MIWRGPMAAGALQQLITQTNWHDLDYLIVDMPPGTSDVFLTVFQSLPVDGIVTVSAPQELVAMIVGKAVNLAKSLEVPVVGLAGAADRRAALAAFDRAAGRFTLPPRTAVVFVVR